MVGKFNYFLPNFYYSVQLKEHEEIKKELVNTKLNMGKPWSLCNVTSSYLHSNESLLDSTFTKVMWREYDEFLSSEFITNSHQFKHPNSSNLSIWMNVYEKGEFQEVHNHIDGELRNTTFSFVYLLHDESETGLCFCSTPPNPLRYSNSKIMHTKDMGITEGSLMIFPSFVDHYVLPATGKRITVSGNIVSES